VGSKVNCNGRGNCNIMKMTAYFRLRFLITLVLILVAASVSSAQKFHWNWRESKYLTAEQSLRKVNVTKFERESLARVVADQLRPMMDEIDIASEKQFQEATLDTRIEMLDLNGDVIPEVIAQGVPGCSPTGNCPYWIFQRNATESTLNVYRFDRSQYHRVNCYDAAWSALEGDIVRNLKEPRITACLRR
jgi:hypothetical protein